MKLKRYLLRFVIALVFLLGASTIAGSHTQASPAAPTFTVNSIFDVAADVSDTNYSVCRTASNNSICTLRAAVMKANRFPGGGATIIIPAGAYTLTIVPAPPHNDSTGAIQITQTTTLNGAGINSTFVDGGGIDRVFVVVSGTVSLANLTIRHGSVSALHYAGGLNNLGLLTLTNIHLTLNQAGNAGGILNSNNLVINTSLIDQNTASGDTGAGGIYNASGTLIISHSVIANNTAAGGAGGGILNQAIESAVPTNITLNDSSVRGNQAQVGAGIYNGYSPGGASLTVNRSTFNANSASIDGGGIYVETGTQLIVNNSTLSANGAQNNGGGILNFGSSALYHTTLAGNIANTGGSGGDGGAIENLNGSVDLWNSLLAENYLTTLVQQCGGADSKSHDYNYIQANCSVTGTLTHNLTGTEPLLGPLQNNGGSTPTRGLFAGSIVSDRIPAGLCRDSFGVAPTTDQRGVQRPINSLCDMGAFEGSLPLPLFNTNLIRNGDAEDGGGSPDGATIGAPHWDETAGEFTVVQYGASGGFPTIGADIIPTTHGYNFFAGGIAASSQAMQMITVTAGSGIIDAGKAKYDLSGDFGGYATQDDSADLVLYFLDSSYTPIGGSINIGGFGAAYRNDQTGLFHASAKGNVPFGTRYVQVYLNMTRASGSYNDGSADNLSLVLYVSRVYLPLITR